MTKQKLRSKENRWRSMDSLCKVRWILCLILPPLALLLPSLYTYPFPQETSSYSDIVVSYFPNAYYLAESIIHWKTIPLWSPTILSGYPFAANPLSGLWYLPNWLAVIFPIPVACNLLVIIHLIGGGIGIYLLLRGEGLSEITALLGGLAFEMMPKLFGHYGGGHMGLIFAVCWTPWLLVSAKSVYGNYQARSEVSRLIRKIILPAIILSGIILADIRWIGFAVLLWVSYLMLVALSRKSMQLHNTPDQDKKIRINSTLRYIFSPILISIGFTAPFLFHFFEYVRLSTRSNLTSTDNLIFSLPPIKILGLVFPPFGDYFEWIVYAGIIVFILASFSWVIKKRSALVNYWTVVFFVSLIFAMGSYLPSASWWASLPGLNLLRVPSRILFINGMALICLASASLEALILGVENLHVKRAKLMMAAYLFFLTGIFLGSVWITHQVVKNLLWSLIVGGVGIIIIGRLIRGNRRSLWLALLFGLSMIDLMGVDLSLFSPRNSQEVFSDGKNVAEYLAQDKDLFRVYSPSYSLPQQVAVVNHIELADGVDPLQLASYVDFMQKASGVKIDGYSVTLPPFSTGNPALDNRTARPDPALLGWLNVKYVIADFDIIENGLEYIERFGQTRIYSNQHWLPRAWLQPVDAPVGENINSVENISWSPNRIVISFSPGYDVQRLVLSEISYPGWQVLVDGDERQIEAVQGLLRSVVIQPGEQHVVFVFRPMSLIIGSVVWLITIILLAGFLFYVGNRPKFSRGK